MRCVRSIGLLLQPPGSTRVEDEYIIGLRQVQSHTACFIDIRKPWFFHPPGTLYYIPTILGTAIKINIRNASRSKMSGRWSAVTNCENTSTLCPPSSTLARVCTTFFQIAGITLICSSIILTDGWRFV